MWILWLWTYSNLKLSAREYNIGVLNTINFFGFRFCGEFSIFFVELVQFRGNSKSYLLSLTYLDSVSKWRTTCFLFDFDEWEIVSDLSSFWNLCSVVLCLNWHQYLKFSVDGVISSMPCRISQIVFSEIGRNISFRK